MINNNFSDEDQDIPTVWTDHMVRCAVQGLLKEMNQSTLAKLSPLSQVGMIMSFSFSYKKSYLFPTESLLLIIKQPKFCTYKHQKKKKIFLGGGGWVGGVVL